MNNPEGNHEGFEQSLLIDDEGELPIAAKQKVVDDNEPPYSPRNEVNFFFYKGIPLGGAAVLEWGVPPTVAMLMAGHVNESARLQSALGYGRVFYNVTTLMVMLALCNYFGTVLPGCIGAGRKDRISDYFRRSMVIGLILMLPIFAIQNFAGLIMEGLGVESSIAADVEVYARIMIFSSCLLFLEIHVEQVFINLDFAHLATLNSLLTGLGVDVVCSYYLIYRQDLGVRGAAYTQIIVKSSRLILWALFALRHRMVGIFTGAFFGGAKEAIFTATELKTYWQLTATNLVGNFSGWFIYELQIMALANVKHITQPALAAGAIWIQLESTLAAVQSGWITTTSMRTLNLMGKLDSGASKSYAILCTLSALLVAVSNVPLLLFSSEIASLVSNDPDVASNLSSIMWVLAVHSQTRISCINANCLFIPIGKGTLGVAQVFVSFYMLGAPLACALALTDWVTEDVVTKMTFIVSGTSVGQVAIAVLGFGYLLRMDWAETAKIIKDRANSDEDGEGTQIGTPSGTPVSTPALKPIERVRSDISSVSI